MVTEIRFPWILRRKPVGLHGVWTCCSGDYALAGAAAVVTPTLDDRCLNAALLFRSWSCGSPIRMREIENMLVGTTLDEQTVQGAADKARSV